MKKNNKLECKLESSKDIKCSLKNSKKNNQCKSEAHDENNQCKLKEKDKNNKFEIKIYKNLFHSDNGVHELIYKDFDIKENKIFLNNSFFRKNKGFVLFYAPWCSHCKTFKKEYEELAMDYIQMFPFGSVNVENVKEGNDKLKVIAKIESVPQLMTITKEGFIKKYDSTYDYDDLLYYINVNN